MLTLETPTHEFDGIVVFRDHAVPTMFHYLAGPPRLTVRDGKPHLLLLKYRHALDSSSAAPKVRDQLGGGFLTFSVDCGIDEDTLRSIRRELASLVPEGLEDQVSLAPVLYTKGTVKVLALDQRSGLASAPGDDTADSPQGRFVRGILGSATPSLLQGQHAIFSIALSPDGVALLEQAFEAELSPIGVLYELEFSGLRPALSVRVRADQKRIYESFETGLGVRVDLETDPETSTSRGSSTSGRSGVALDLDLDRTIESLVRSGAIEIEIIQQQVGTSVDEMRADAMKMIKEDILQEFFSPTLSSSAATQATQATRDAIASTAAISKGRASDPGSGDTRALELGFQLEYKNKNELETITYNYDVAQPEARIHAPNGFFSALTRGTEMKDHIREVDFDDPFFQMLDVEVQTTADFKSLALQTVVVELQYGGEIEAPDQTASLTFSAAEREPRRFQSFRNRDDFSYRYRVHYTFAVDDEVAAQSYAHSTPWQTTTRRTLVVHPAEDVDMVRIYLEPALVPWDLVEQIEVQLSYDHPASDFRSERTFMVRRDSSAKAWIVRLPEGASPEYGARYTWYLSNGAKLRGEAQRLRYPRLFVPGPFTGRLRIRVVPGVDPSAVGLILVEIVHTDPQTGLEIRKSLSMSPPYRPTTVEIPLVDPENDEYSWSYRLLPLGGGSGEDEGPFSTRARALVISDGEVIYYDVEVIIIGDLMASEILAVQVDLRAEPPEGRQAQIRSHLFEAGGDDRMTQKLMLRQDREPVFEVQTTALTMSGDSIVREWTEHEGPILGLELTTLLTPWQAEA